MLRRLSLAVLPVLCLFSLLCVASAFAQSAPPMMVQVPWISVAAGNITSSGTAATTLPTGCTTGLPIMGGSTTGSPTTADNYGDGCPANEIFASGPIGAAVDSWGNVYFTDATHLYVRVIYAGTGAANLYGVSTTNPAAAMITAAYGGGTSIARTVTLTPGNVYAIAGGYTGVLSTGYCNSNGSGPAYNNTNGDRCPATYSYLKGPYGPAVDSQGNLFIPDKSNSVIYVVLANTSGLAAQLVHLETGIAYASLNVGYIYAIVSNGGSGYADGAPAYTGKVKSPYAIAVDASENLYISDYGNNAIRMVNGPGNTSSGGVGAGYIHTIGGDCTNTPTPGCTALAAAPSSGYPATANAATSAFVDPWGIAVDSYGNVYVGDNGGAVSGVPSTLRVIYGNVPNNPVANLICTVNYSSSYCGTNQPAANDVYTIAGSGTYAANAATGNGALATSATFERLGGVALDAHGNVYVGDYYGGGMSIGEINAKTGYLTFLEGGAYGTALGVGDNCVTGTTASNGPTMTDNYGDGCPATEAKGDHVYGNPAFDASGNLYYADYGYNLIRKLTFNNVFPATTGSNPITQNLAFELLDGTGATTYQATGVFESVFTQGISASSEFTATGGSGDTCSNASKLYSYPTVPGTGATAGIDPSSSNQFTTCVVPITFTPTKVGLRSGAVEISATINGSTVIMTPAYLSGVGNGTALAIDPGASSALGSGSNPEGVIADSANNVYVAYENGTVWRMPNSGGAGVEVGSGLTSPHQLALDGFGDLFISDSGTNEIVEFPGASTASSLVAPQTAVSDLSGPTGVAVDGAGNLYIAEPGNLLMQPVGSGALTAIGSGFMTPASVAVDASGNVYVADSSANTVEKLAIANGVVAAQSPITLLSSAAPVSVAVDAAGDVYYGDSSSGQVVEVPVNGILASIVNGLTHPVGLALDPSGNLYVADSSNTSGIKFVQRTAAALPAISEGAQSVATLTNIGNLSYIGGISGNSDSNSANDFTFAAAAGNGCSTPTTPSLTLNSGTNCGLAITANTSTASDKVSFSSSSSTLSLSSAGALLVNTTIALSIPTTSLTYGAAITGTATVTPASGSANPTGTVTLYNASTSLGTCTLSNASGATSTCNFALAGVSAGSITVTAVYGGDSNFNPSPVSNGIGVNIAQLGTATSLSVTTTSVTEGSAFTGTVAVSPSAGTGTVDVYLDGAVAASCSLTSASPGMCPWAISWTLAALPVGSHTLTASYLGSTDYSSSSTTTGTPSGTSIRVTAPLQATAVATGDTRTVTEPSFPAVCRQLTAAITQVNNDIPTTVDATNSNPDGARIQTALNYCSANNPGQAVELSVDGSGAFNAFLSGPLVMPSNVTLLVDPGVTLFFSRNAQDYDMVSGTHTCGTVNSASATANCQPLIGIPGTSTNVGIMGYGKLDGRGGDTLLNAIAPYGSYSWWGLSSAANGVGNQQNPRFVQMDTGASNITLYKITLRNSPMFHISTTGAVSGFTAWDIKIVTPTNSRNTDGIDPGNATNFTITRSWISDGDDNVAVGASGTTAPAANISVTNNHFFAGHGESIGSYTGAGVSNVLFDSNMSSGNGTAGSGSSINNTADSNSTGIRLKSGYDRGGLVQNIQFSNSCYQYHHTAVDFNPNYESTSGSLTPNFTNILMQNLSFGATTTEGTAQFTGSSNNGTVYPLGITLDNVSFPTTYAATQFTPAPTNVSLTYGPGDVSSDFVSDYATFVPPANTTSSNTVFDNRTVQALFPPTCNFTYLSPELTGPNGLPQTILAGQNAAAVVILTPAVGGAPYPITTVTLTDAPTGTTYSGAMIGAGDTITIPLTGLAAGTHTFSATYTADTVNGYAASASPFGSYVVTVNSTGTLGGTTTHLTLGANSESYGTSVTATASVSGSNPTGTVQFIVSGGGLTGSTVFSAVAVSGGSATAYIALPYSTTAYDITAVYSGDGVNAGSASGVSSLTVAPATTSTTLSVNTNSAQLGHPVIVTASVAPVISSAGTPAGTVTFTYSTTIGGAQTALGSTSLSNGSAAISAELPIGTNYVTATYTANGSYAGSTTATALAIAITTPSIAALPNNPIALPYTMTTIAGGGTYSIPASGNMGCSGATDKFGDGCLATAIAFTASDDMRAVAADPFGNIYLSDISAALVRRIAPNGVIANFAGKVSGTACVPPASTSANGSGCTPTLVSLNKPRGVSADAAGNVFIADYGLDKVFEIKVADGLMYLVAGSTAGNSGDGGSAVSAQLNQPRGAWGDAVGNVYIADTTDNRIRVVDPVGNIHAFAGTGTAASNGDGAAGTAAAINNPQGVMTDLNLNVYIADSSSGRIRVVCVTCGTSSPLDYLLQALGVTTTLNTGTNGYIYTIAGSGSTAAYSSYSVPVKATLVSMAPQKLAMDNSGNLYISDGNGFIWMLDFHTGYLRAIAANGTVCSTKTDSYGDGCPATQASFGDGGNGIGVGVDTLGNMYISDTTNGLIRKVVTGLQSSSVSTGSSIAQTVNLHFAANDSPAGSNTLAGTSSQWSFGAPNCATNGDSTQDCLLTSTFTPAIPGGLSTTLTVNSSQGNVAYLGLTGTGIGPGVTLDPASQSGFGDGLSVAGLAVDANSNVYISDAISKNLLEYSPAMIATILGGGSATPNPLATLAAPGPVVVDQRGYIYVADTAAGTINQINPALNSSVLASGFSAPAGLTVDAQDNLYLSDSTAKAVYQINPFTGAQRTLPVGTLVSPKGLSIDPSGNLLIADTGAPAIYRFNFASGARSTVSNSAVAPAAIVTDAAGNLLIADTASIVAVPASSNSASFTAAGITPTALAIDAAGNLYTGSAGGILRLNRTQGSLLFSGTSAPSQVAYMLESGNAALSGASLSQTDTADFSLIGVATPDCTLISTLPSGIAIGGICTLTANYTPTTYNATTDTTTVSGPLNAVLSTPSLIQLNLSGSGNSPIPTVTLGSIAPPSPVYGQSVSITATVTGASLTPAGSVSFYLDGNTTAAATVNLLSGLASTTFSGLTGTTHTVTAAYASTNGYAAVVSAVATITINKAVPAITINNIPSNAMYNGSFAPTFTYTGNGIISVASGTTSVCTVNAASGLVNFVGAGTCSLTASATATADYAAATGSAQTFTVANPMPVINSMSPALTSAGNAAFTLTVNGTGFVSNSTVYWGAVALATQYVDATQLTASVTAADIASAGATAITVQTPTPGGGTSNVMQYEVEPAQSGSNTVPTFTTSTATVSAGATAAYPVSVPSTTTNLSVTCLNLPAGATCSYSSSSNSVAIATSTTTPKGTYQITVVFTETVASAATSLVLLPALLLPLLLIRKRLAARGIWLAACLAVVMLGGAVLATGCGGSSSSTSTSHQVTSASAVTLTIQ